MTVLQVLTRFWSVFVVSRRLLIHHVWSHPSRHLMVAAATSCLCNLKSFSGAATVMNRPEAQKRWCGHCWLQDGWAGCSSTGKSLDSQVHNRSGVEEAGLADAAPLCEDLKAFTKNVQHCCAQCYTAGKSVSIKDDNKKSGVCRMRWVLHCMWCVCL